MDIYIPAFKINNKCSWQKNKIKQNKRDKIKYVTKSK